MDISLKPSSLLENLGVRLSAKDNPSVQSFVRRFATLYRSTWERLAEHVREALAKNWRASKDGVATIDIEFLAGHSYGQQTFGNYDHPNHFDFHPDIQMWGADLIETLIAHELAHCFLGHFGSLSEANEDEADACVESWGFPMGELRKQLKG